MNRTARTLSVFAGAIVALAAARARAGDATSEVKAALDAQAAAIVSGDVESFVHTIAPDSFTVLPGGMGESPLQAAIAARHTWHAAGRPATAARFGKVVVGTDGTVAWVAAELSVTIKSKPVTYRVTELLVHRHAGWAAQAMMVSRAVPTFAGNVNDEFAMPGASDDPDKVAMADWIAGLGDLGAHLRAGNDVVVLGSGPGDRGEGAPAARRLFAAWKKRTFTTQAVRGGSDGTSYAYAFGVLRDVDGGNPSWVMLEGVRHGDAWQVVGVHVSQDRPVAELAED